MPADAGCCSWCPRSCRSRSRWSCRPRWRSSCLLFIFSAEILGEISSFYVLFPFWDTTLHTLNGFLAAAIGFSLVDLLNRSDRVKFDLSPLFLSITAFCFSMTIGVLWEFFEFAMDQFFALDMQKDTIGACDPFGNARPDEYEHHGHDRRHHRYDGQRRRPGCRRIPRPSV